jgi:hypothetical protein
MPSVKGTGFRLTHTTALRRAPIPAHAAKLGNIAWVCSFVMVRRTGGIMATEFNNQTVIESLLALVPQGVETPWSANLPPNRHSREKAGGKCKPPGINHELRTQSKYFSFLRIFYAEYERP